MQEQIERIQELADQLLFHSLCVRRKTMPDFVSKEDLKEHCQRLTSEIGIHTRQQELLKGYNVVENIVDEIYLKLEELRNSK